MALIIDAETLKRRLDAGERLILINVLPEEVFAAAHLPGSLNACVYEIGFPQKVESFVPTKAQPVVVYGQGERYLASQRAAERLVGYDQVIDFRGGIDAWKSAGFPLEGHGRLPQSELRDGTFSIDLSQSSVAWEGSSFSARHSGTIGLKSGSVTVEGGKAVGAECVVDMDSMVCGDLRDPDLNAALLAHLKSDDFFDVETYPEGKFALRAFELIAGAHLGEPNVQVKGDLTLRGTAQPLEFAAVAGVHDGRYVLQTWLEIDRTRWNVRYGSSKFFEWLGMHLVSDIISLRLWMVAPLFPSETAELAAQF